MRDFAKRYYKPDNAGGGSQRLATFLWLAASGALLAASVALTDRYLGPKPDRLLPLVPENASLYLHTDFRRLPAAQNTGPVRVPPGLAPDEASFALLRSADGTVHSIKLMGWDAPTTTEEQEKLRTAGAQRIDDNTYAIAEGDVILADGPRSAPIHQDLAARLIRAHNTSSISGFINLGLMSAGAPAAFSGFSGWGTAIITARNAGNIAIVRINTSPGAPSTAIVSPDASDMIAGDGADGLSSTFPANPSFTEATLAVQESFDQPHAITLRIGSQNVPSAIASSFRVADLRTAEQAMFRYLSFLYSSKSDFFTPEGVPVREYIISPPVMRYAAGGDLQIGPSKDGEPYIVFHKKNNTATIFRGVGADFPRFGGAASDGCPSGHPSIVVTDPHNLAPLLPIELSTALQLSSQETAIFSRSVDNSIIYCGYSRLRVDKISKKNIYFIHNGFRVSPLLKK